MNEVDLRVKELEDMPLDKKEKKFIDDHKRMDKIFNRELDIIESDLKELNLKLENF